MKFESTEYPEADRRFRKPEKVLEWLDGELETWRWLEKTGVQQSAQAFQKLSNSLSQASSNLRNSLAAKDDEDEQLKWAEDALRRIAQLCNNQSYLPSTAALGRYILDLKERDPQLAGVVTFLAVSGRLDGLPNSRIFMEAAASLQIFYKGVTSESAAVASQQIAAAKAEIAELLAESEQEARALIDELVATTRNKVTAYKRSRTTLARWIVRKRKQTEKEKRQFEDQARDATSVLVENSEAKVQKFLDFYRNQIALQEPVSYWGAKQVVHRRATFALAGVFILYGWAVSKFVWANYSEGNFDVSGLIDIFQSQPVATLTGLVVVLTLVLIVSRIIYRLFLSQLHLWNDASERVTMIKTYLALASRDHAREEHLIALTNRIFSPASDGVVKDDFGSIGVLDVIANRLK